MKKAFIFSLVFAVMCCLFGTSFGATVSTMTQVINGNTYIYPEGLANTVNNDIIIQKNYTDQQIQQAEDSLKSIFSTFYLTNDKGINDSLATCETLQNDCKYDNFTIDNSTLCRLSLIDLRAFSKTNKVFQALNDPMKSRYQLMLKNTQGNYAGLEFIDVADGNYIASAYQKFASAYITNDLRTHAVELYNVLKDSGLDLTKTTAKYFQIDEIGWFYLFTDGSSEFVIPTGYQFDFSPYENGEGYPDASASFQLVRGEDFIKAMIKAEQNMATAAAEAAKSYSGEPQMGGTTTPDTPAPNDHTILYIAIACFAVAAASVVVYIVIRKKRVSNKV